jgi:hypothetical protein
VIDLLVFRFYLWRGKVVVDDLWPQSDIHTVAGSRLAGCKLPATVSDVIVCANMRKMQQPVVYMPDCLHTFFLLLRFS